MQLVILDYGSGNLRSVAQAVRRAAADMSADTAAPAINISVCQTIEAVQQADIIILPGVGHFADCLAGLSRIDGMLAVLDEQVQQKAKPFLGICVGMQLMANRGFEGAQSDGFGWIDGDVVALKGGEDAAGRGLKIPHMGWNNLQLQQPEHPLCAGLSAADQVYFLHSYQMQLADQNASLASTLYGEPITAMVVRDTMFGTQFHPEKSQHVGQKILRNFLSWRP